MFDRLAAARVATLSAAVAVVAGCHTFGPVASPRDFLASSQPERVWVTSADGSVSVFDGPRLVGDTLAGFVGGAYQEVPLANVKQIAARQAAPRRTRFSIIAGSIAAIGFVWFVAGGGLGNSSTPEDEEDYPPPN